MDNGFPFPATTQVNVYWGNSNYAIKIATCQANDGMREAMAWFRENNHYFHLENFPPYHRLISHPECAIIDYGSYVHFLYFIPA